MPAPVSRTVRVALPLIARLETLRAREEARAGVPVDLRTIVERIVRDGIERAERVESVNAIATV